MERELLWNIEEFEADAELAANDLVETIKQYCPGDTLWIDASKTDWRGRPGHKTVDMSMSNDQIFAAIMPSHECSFNLYKEGNEIYAIVSSHDIPTGARWSFEGLKDEC